MNVPPPPDDTDWKLNGEPPSPTFLLLSVLSAVAVFLLFDFAFSLSLIGGRRQGGGIFVTRSDAAATILEWRT